MGWTKNTPPKFIDEQRANSRLHSCARERMEALSESKQYIEDPQAVLADLEHLLALARAVHDDSLESLEQISGVLFTDGALELLSFKCRNRYWMWYLLSFVRTSTYPINALAVARAHARAKDSLHDNRYGFAFVSPENVYFEMRGMPLGFILEMFDKGRLLVVAKSDGNGYPVILNPLLVDD